MYKNNRFLRSWPSPQNQGKVAPGQNLDLRLCPFNPLLRWWISESNIASAKIHPWNFPTLCLVKKTPFQPVTPWEFSPEKGPNRTPNPQPDRLPNSHHRRKPRRNSAAAWRSWWQVSTSSSATSRAYRLGGWNQPWNQTARFFLG